MSKAIKRDKTPRPAGGNVIRLMPKARNVDPATTSVSAVVIDLRSRLSEMITCLEARMWDAHMKTNEFMSRAYELNLRITRLKARLSP